MTQIGKAKKTFSKRLKVTRRGKVLSRKTGQNHFRAKKTRKRELDGKRLQDFVISKKTLSKYLL
jgi:ribosomal protein L35